MNAHLPSGLSVTRDQVADLLIRYPHVSDEETRTILTFLRKGRHLDVGIITADERLKPNLHRFMEAHARHFRLGWGEASGVIAGIAGLLVACWVIWEVIKPAAL